MTDENDNQDQEPLTEEDFLAMFHPEEDIEEMEEDLGELEEVEEMEENTPSNSKSSMIKMLAILFVLTIFAGALGFLLTKVVFSSENKTTEQPPQEEIVDGEIAVPSFFFSEESRWFCVNENVIVDCSTPHLEERHYYHFNSPHGTVDPVIVEQAKNQQIAPEEFCKAWFSSSAIDPELILNPEKTTITFDPSPAGVFCDLKFTEPQTGLALNFQTS